MEPRHKGILALLLFGTLSCVLAEEELFARLAVDESISEWSRFGDSSSTFDSMLAGPMEPIGSDDESLEKRQRMQCRPGTVQCPNMPMWCSPPGMTCCPGTQSWVNPATGYCCGGGGLNPFCALGQKCCTISCCPSYGRCGLDGFCSTRVQTQTATRTTTTTSTTTTTTTTKSTTTTTGRACSVTNRGRAATHTVTMTFHEKETQVPDGRGGKKTICLDNREVLKSMCKGIDKYRGCASDDIELEIEPDKKTVDQHRAKKCPDKFCFPQNIDCDPANPGLDCNQYYQFTNQVPHTLRGNHAFKLTCDEFPFAGSKQGGDPTKGSSICVPAWQQSWQGSQLRGLAAKAGPSGKYVLKISGWDCKSNRPRAGAVGNCKGGRRRDIETRDIETADQVSITEDDLFYNLMDTGENGLLLYLGDLPAGVYTYTLNLGEGDITSLSVIDYLGREYLSLPDGLQPGSGPKTISFNLTSEAYAITLLALTNDNKLSLDYNVTGATGEDAWASAVTPEPTPEPSPPIVQDSALSVVRVDVIGLLLLVVSGAILLYQV